MAQWKACIVGDETYLADLMKAYAENLTFEKANDGWFISGRLFDDCSSPEECREVAAAWLNRVNGSATLLGGLAVPLELNYVFYLQNDGHRQVYVLVHNTIGVSASIHGTVTRNNEVIDEFYPAQLVPTWVRLAEADSSVQKVLSLLSGRDLSWVNLYRVFEVIRADVGGAKKLDKKQWLSSAAINSFTHSANHPSVGGNDARHGHQSSDPPAKPMERYEAEALVKSLVLQWLTEKAGEINAYGNQ